MSLHRIVIGMMTLYTRSFVLIPNWNVPWADNPCSLYLSNARTAARKFLQVIEKKTANMKLGTIMALDS